MNKEFSLDNKVALISGSSRGIGFAIAKTFALHGAKVIITSRNEANLIKAKKEINDAGGQADYCQTHFGKQKEIEKLFRRLEKKYSTVDILVNNFAINPVFKNLVEYDLSLWEKMLNHNLTNYFYTSKLASQLMIKARYGKIINISSHASYHPFKTAGAYAIVKSGIDMLTRVLALELADYNINVNGIAPGYIDTDFNKNRTDLPPANELTRLIPIHHIGQAQDIANLALFLASEEAKYITGEIIIADGGYVKLKQ